MQGLELSRRYYEEVGKPMLKREFPELMPRLSAGLAGEGSECLGFDDDISRDHDFGAGFCLWLSIEDYAEYGKKLQDAYDRMPKEFEGIPARHVSERGGKRVGVFEIKEFISRFIGDEQPPKSLNRWLYLPEDKLAAITGGEVFEDGSGEFSKIRLALQEYYPEDVRIKKIAARAAKMAQSGQYNYARCMKRGDTVAAMLALDEFVRQAISMIYLLNRRYMPYYKWMFRGMKNFRILPDVSDKIRELLLFGDTGKMWEPPFPPGWNPYVNKLDPRVVKIEEICKEVIEELRKQGLTDSRDDFLEVHTWDIMKRIQDPWLRSLHVMEG